MVKVYIEEYGCTANQDDANIMKGLINKAGYKLTEDINISDVVVVVTCIVKEKTAQKITHKIKSIQNNYSNKKLIIAGCMPEAESNLCKELFPNSSLINTFHVTEISKVVKETLENGPIHFLGKRQEIKLNLPKIIKDNASVQIAQGCTSSCSFCQTKLAKGYIKSYPEKLIINEIRNLKNKNIKKINLTSTDNGCYGLDINTNLPTLLKKIIKIEGNFLIRIGMMNPEHVINFLDDLILAYKSEKIMKFLHIPVQSGSNKILKEMNRKYTVKDFKKIINKFRKEIPNISISTDIIVGYPTETEQDFNKTLNLIKEINPEVLNISKFSPRPGTKAAKLKLLPTQEVKRRSTLITKIYKEIKNN